MRRPARVVDEDVRLGTRGERRGAARFGRDVAGHRRHFGAGCGADFRGGLFQRLGCARGDRHRDAGMRQRHRAGPAQPLARRADDRPAAGNAQIQHLSSCISRLLPHSPRLL